MVTVGDVGYLDDDGYLYLTDRSTFMIISGGVNIYPQETENLLITHPKVADAAVFGVPNEDLGEEVKAVVQLMPGIDPGPDTAAELIAFCREHLAHLKCPRSVDFTDELPRLPTGKLYKKALRDSYWGKSPSRIVLRPRACPAGGTAGRLGVVLPNATSLAMAVTRAESGSALDLRFDHAQRPRLVRPACRRVLRARLPWEAGSHRARRRHRVPRRPGRGPRRSPRGYCRMHCSVSSGRW